MIIGKITFGKTIAMPGYNNDKPEIEAILEDGDTVEAVLSSLNKRLIAWHKAEYPHLYQDENKEPWLHADVIAPRQKIEFRRVDDPPPVINIQDEKTNPISYLMDIQNAPDMATLTSFKRIAASNPDLYKAYCQRLKTLNPNG